MKPFLLAYNILVDILEVIGLGFSSLFVYPCVWLGRHSANALIRVRFLVPRALMGMYFQGRFRAHIHQNNKAILIYHQLLKIFENEFHPAEVTHNVPLNHFLQLIYGEFMAIYIKMGDLDQASSVLIRANGHIGCEFLPGHGEFSLQTAHIIKAGFAAGRLLDDDSVRGLFQSGKSIIIKASPQKETSTFIKERKESQSRPGRSSGAKVLPFKRPEHRK